MWWDGMAHPLVASVMEGGGGSWWRAGDRSSNLLLGQALTADPSRPIQRLSEGFVCYISTGSPKEKFDLSNTATGDI
jgi:hypothetical protein